MSRLQRCTCGNEYEVFYPEDVITCSICCELACNECSHSCENPEHTIDDLGCEKCMFYNHDLSMWFCSKDCENAVIDPYGYLQTAKDNMQKMSLAVHEAIKALDEGVATSNAGKFAEAKATLVTAHELYLKEDK